MKSRLSTQDLVALANKEKMPIAEIALRAGMSRQAVYKRLARSGEYILRKAPGGAPGKRMTGPCGFCGATVERYRSKVVRQKQIQFFCGHECYYASLEQHPFEEWRHGSRLARAVVAQHFPLRDEHVVHHKDGDQRHNDRSNLMVFKDQTDHMAHHRGRKVKALWDGANV